MHKEIFIRFDRCLGCRSCEIACAVAHSEDRSLIGAIKQSPLPKKRIFVEQVDSLKAPVTCRHCREAYCVNACISGAMRRTPDGLVTNLGTEQKCTGCWMCVMVCPYGVIRRDQEKGIAMKCDRECFDEKGIPACVQACPTRALIFTTLEEFEADKRRGYLARTILAAAGS